MTWALQVIRAADPAPGWMVALSVAIAGYAVAIAVADVRSVDESLAVLMLWQMLSASSGFARAATAGHFDPLLVRLDRRLIAVAHLVHSVWPVASAWIAVATLERIVHDTSRGFELGRVSAFLFVSVMCWALSLPGARLVAGMLWLLLIVLGVATTVGAEQYAAMLARADGSMPELLHASALAIICPFLLLGDHVPPRESVSLVLLVMSLTMAVLAVRYVRRRDYPLEASS